MGNKKNRNLNNEIKKESQEEVLDTINETVPGLAEEIRKTEAKAALELVPSITYVGPKAFAKIICGNRRTYSFSPTNSFTETPTSFEDFYEIMAANDGLFALELDPKAMKIQSNRARVTSARLEQEKLEEVRRAEIAKANDTDVARHNRAKIKFEEDRRFFIEQVRHKIASGEADELPLDLEEQALDYAKSLEVKQTVVAEAITEVKINE